MFYFALALSFAFSSFGTWRANNELLGSAAIWAPAPMLILSVIAASYRAGPILGSLDAFRTGLILSAAWLGLVLMGVAAFRALYRGWRDDEFVGDLAVIAGWTGIWILPLSGMLRFTG